MLNLIGKQNDNYNYESHDMKIRQYSYSNPWIIKNGCVMTVVVSMIDPIFDPSVFVILESVAKNVHPIDETCVVIQTSLCRIQQEYNLTEDDTSYNKAYTIVTELIYNSSNPLLRTLIELGNVRVSILNHKKYQISRCQNLSSFDAAFLNIDYWSDYYYINSDGNKVTIDNNNLNQELVPVLHGEFVPKQDSDFVLVIRSDAVLCHGLDVKLWNHFAYVGAPWDKDLFCNEFQHRWNKWHISSTGNNESISTTVPDYPSDMCSNIDVAPVGNGDLSLRSRYWMREAIRYCPQVNYSGLSDVDVQNAACHHHDDSREDVYFGVILRGIFFNNKTITTHRMPTVLEAALFSSEGMYFTDHYNAFPTSFQYSEEALVKQLWWEGENITWDNNINSNSVSYHAGWERYQRMKAIWIQSHLVKPIVPIGYHAIHGFNHSGSYSEYHHIVRECPYIVDILPANFSVPPESVTGIQNTIDNVNMNSHALIRNEVLNNLMMKQYSYRNPWIIKNGCVMTVVLLDPDLGSSVFFSLESVAKNVHPINETCIVIQTSLCRIQTEHKLEMTSASYDEAYIILTDTIYNSSKPLFRRLIESGNVRVSIFDHTKYQTNNCQDFRSVNAPFFNIHYWSNYYYIDSNGNRVPMNSNTSNATIIDTGSQITITSDDDMNQQLLVLNGEFVPEQDSDFVLVIQNDVVLCHGLDVYSWNQFPYVGAPWVPRLFCNKFKDQWRGWHTLAIGYNESISTIPEYPSNMCSDPEVGPLGNGGLSLRSRYWMREAIRYCPQVNYSGLSEEEIQNAKCLHYKIGFDSQEDVYYGMLIKGIFFNRKNITSHKMPTLLDAALFATETRYYVDFYDNLKIAPEYSIEANVRDRWWSGEKHGGTRGNNNTNNITDPTSFHEGWERFQRMQKVYFDSNKTMPIVPIGYHDVTRYYDPSKNILAYQHILQECPYLIGLLPSEFIDAHLRNVTSTIVA